jgi:hypothetical protein
MLQVFSIEKNLTGLQASETGMVQTPVEADMRIVDVCVSRTFIIYLFFIFNIN